ncbi:MAG: hypothetical protein P9L94_19295 [Candidatus Hinthialibacter antarcticus]|nr:hypothetical protein [Candidatus Hinthialibacter antarcticus]
MKLDPIGRTFLFLAAFALFVLTTFAMPTQGDDIIQTPEQAMEWLKQKSTQMVHECRREMDDGTAAFPPQVGLGYEAFWLRDYAYMLEGNPGAFTAKEMTDACRLFAGKLNPDGAGVDCIKFDGTPIYKPGFGSLGENPVADGSQFTVDVAWHTYQQTKDRALIREIIDALLKTMRACPRQANGLVYIDPNRDYDRCPYGFTDTVRKQGAVLFSSLLYVQASRQLSDLLGAIERGDEAQQWLNQAKSLTDAIHETFWDDEVGLYRAATVRCREHDIWGSAFAVYLGVAANDQAQRISQYFADHYHELVQDGQVRHTRGGVYWQDAREQDAYQNGAFWATPSGWFAYALNISNPAMADQMIVDLANDLKKRNAPEWIFKETARLPGYNASAALPIAGIQKLLHQRKTR